MVKKKAVSNLEARKILNLLLNRFDLSISAHLLRAHIFNLHLFSRNGGRKFPVFIEKEEAESLIIGVSNNYKRVHIEGNFFSRLWHLGAVFNMIDAGLWDDECKERLRELLKEPKACVALCLMLLGRGTGVSRHAVDELVGADFLGKRAAEILNSLSSGLEKSAVAALERASSGDFAPI